MFVAILEPICPSGNYLQLFQKTLSSCVFSSFFLTGGIWLPGTAQNGWLPIWGTCGTSHFDTKMPRDGRYSHGYCGVWLHVHFMHIGKYIFKKLYRGNCRKYVCHSSFTLFWCTIQPYKFMYGFQPRQKILI